MPIKSPYLAGIRFDRASPLGREAFAFMKQNPKLLVFPLVAVTALFGVFGLVLLGAFNRTSLSWLFNQRDGQWLSSTPYYSLVVPGIILTFYLVLTFIFIFCNVALCGTMLARQKTGRLSLRDGLSAALRRLPQILAWTIFAATVGHILMFLRRFLREHLSWFGDFAGFLIQGAWAALIYFVAPVLVVEGVGPITALKSSVDILKSRWAQADGAEFSCAMAVWPLHLVGLILVSTRIAYGYFDMHFLSAGQLNALHGFIAVYAFITFTLHSVMSGILQSHLYLYAKTGEVPLGSDATAYARAFR